MNVLRATLIAFSAFSISAFGQFSAGNLAVLRVGDGVQTLTSFGHSVFIDQYTTAGGFVNSVTAPSSGSGTVLQRCFVTLRAAGILNGNLYYSHTGATNTGPGIYGYSGLPTGPATPTQIINTGSGAGSDEFEFNSAGTVAYVADDRAVASGGGILKWTFIGSSWTLAYTITSDGANEERGFAVDLSGGRLVVYATKGEGSAGQATKV